MSHVFRKDEITFQQTTSTIQEFSRHSSENLTRLAQSKHLHMNIRRLEPGYYSCPYHFHRNAEELFVILSGTCTLRTQEGFQELCQGDMVFFEMGPSGAHQLYNHSSSVCEYIDLRTEAGIDICEYPDSGKVNIIPYLEIYETKDMVDYYKGEDKVAEKWEIRKEL